MWIIRLALNKLYLFCPIATKTHPKDLITWYNLHKHPFSWNPSYMMPNTSITNFPIQPLQPQHSITTFLDKKDETTCKQYGDKSLTNHQHIPKHSNIQPIP
jgi:hypothetical protein